MAIKYNEITGEFEEVVEVKTPELDSIEDDVKKILKFVLEKDNIIIGNTSMLHLKSRGYDVKEYTSYWFCFDAGISRSLNAHKKSGLIDELSIWLNCLPSNMSKLGKRSQTFTEWKSLIQSTFSNSKVIYKPYIYKDYFCSTIETEIKATNLKIQFCIFDQIKKTIASPNELVHIAYLQFSFDLSKVAELNLWLNSADIAKVPTPQGRMPEKTISVPSPTVISATPRATTTPKPDYLMSDEEFVEAQFKRIRKRGSLRFIAITNTLIGSARTSEQVRPLWLSNNCVKFRTAKGCEYSTDWGMTYISIPYPDGEDTIRQAVEYTCRLFRIVGVMNDFRRNGSRAVDYIVKNNLLR